MVRKKRAKNAASPKALREAVVRMADSDGMVRSRGKKRWEMTSESSSRILACGDRDREGHQMRVPVPRRGVPDQHAMAIEIMMLR